MNFELSTTLSPCATYEWWTLVVFILGMGTYALFNKLIWRLDPVADPPGGQMYVTYIQSIYYVCPADMNCETLTEVEGVKYIVNKNLHTVCLNANQNRNARTRREIQNFVRFLRAKNRKYFLPLV